MAKLHLQGFQEIVFSEPREAEEFLSQIADSISAVRFNGPASEFHMRYTGGSLGHCALHQGEHSGLSFSVARADEFHIILPLRHDVRFSNNAGAEAAVAGRSILLLPPRVEGGVETPLGTHAISLIAPAASVAAHAEKLLGSGKQINVSGQVTVLDTASPIVSTLGRNISTVLREMLHLSNTGLSALAAANFDELLLGLASAVIWPVVLSGGTEKASDPAPAVVRRARDYIRAHAEEPIRLADLARQLGITLRALQIGFRRHVGCSPRDYLMACRLELARTRLLAADANTKVATVAFDSGFTDLAVFSMKYRLAFGELPSETLRKRQ
ncbi:MAG TPA: AraC family transcriptional regulator [Hyphomicrobiaceae bacterium]|nr:AraC family transcriptional regulator [Hyphomicrobiaceae bacterium]